MDKNRGFAAIEAVFVIIVLLALGGLGWYVWQANQVAHNSLSKADTVNSGDAAKVSPIDSYADCLKFKTSTQDKKAFPQTCTTKAGKKFTDPNPTATWKQYASQTGKYTVKYPAGWRADVCDPNATDLTLYLGPTKASSVICDTEHGSQIMLISTSAVPTASEQTLDDEYYDQKTSTKVVVDGVTGTRLSGRLKVDAEWAAPLKTGSIVVNYFFLAPGRSYIATYVQATSGDYASNNLAVFDYLVQKTLQFSD